MILSVRGGNRPLIWHALLTTHGVAPQLSLTPPGGPVRSTSNVAAAIGPLLLFTWPAGHETRNLHRGYAKWTRGFRHVAFRACSCGWGRECRCVLFGRAGAEAGG